VRLGDVIAGHKHQLQQLSADNASLFGIINDASVVLKHALQAGRQAANQCHESLMGEFKLSLSHTCRSGERGHGQGVRMLNASF